MSHNLQASNGVIHEIDAVLVPPMQTAIKPVSPLEAAKTISAAPITLRIDTPPKNGFASRKSSTIF
jgi:hypothetical protein